MVIVDVCDFKILTNLVITFTCTNICVQTSCTIITASALIPTRCSFNAQLEKMAGLEREKQQMRDRAYSLEAQLVLKGRAVKEVEGRIEETELKQKEVCTCGVMEVLHVHVHVHVCSTVNPCIIM